MHICIYSLQQKFWLEKKQHILFGHPTTKQLIINDYSNSNAYNNSNNSNSCSEIFMLLQMPQIQYSSMLIVILPHLAQYLLKFRSCMYIFLKKPSCKLYNNKSMIISTQITNTDVFAFIAFLVFELLSRKILFVNRKNNSNC